MIKGLMSPDKSQLPDVLKWGTPVIAAKFAKRLYYVAGYRNFVCVLVSAAGGASGTVTGDSDTSSGASGGGGGSMLAFAGLLEDLPDECELSVGARGTPGANVGNNATAGIGGIGGTTAFTTYDGTWQVTGGEGGTPGRVKVSSGIASWDRRGRGGNGGVAIEPSGSFAAVGGLGGGDVVGSAVNDTPTEGTYQQAGELWLPGTLVGGGGGGGGAGRIRINGSVPYASQDGADSQAGVGGVSPYAHDGGVKTSSTGGHGGGVNIEPFTGTPEIRGSYVAGANPDGVVLLLLS